MPVRRTPDGRWRYRHVVHYPDGTRERITGSAPTHVNNRAAAQQAMLDHIERCLHPERTPTRKETPTFEAWFHGRFWKEWVIGERNKPSEQIAKKSIYKTHLGPALGKLALDEIGTEQIQQLRASLVEQGLGDKRINNVMAVLSKALRYAADCELIDRVPKIRLRRVDRAEIDAWPFEEYAALLVAARAESPMWYAAACLAGEAGLRVGEIRALKWREDVDLANGQLTINRQAGNGHEGTPKGRTRRTVPMTSTLVAALEALPVEGDLRDLRGAAIRTGYVVRNDDGSPMRDAQTSHAIYRVCRGAALDERGWHVLRHSFGTHAARFSVNPWQLMEWMGHKRIDETMGYVHLVERQPRPLPEAIVAAGMRETDPTARVIAMLGARESLGRGKAVAKTEDAAITSRKKSQR